MFIISPTRHHIATHDQVLFIILVDVENKSKDRLVIKIRSHPQERNELRAVFLCGVFRAERGLSTGADVALGSIEQGTSYKVN